MESQLEIVTATGNVPLDMEFLPTGLFMEEKNAAIERNQDSNSTFLFTDGLPMPRTLDVVGLKRFTTLQERDTYLAELRELIEAAESLEYAGEIGFQVEAGWLSVGFSPNRVLDVDITIRFSFPDTSLSSYWLDGVYMFRDDILMSRSDISMETLRSA